MHLYILLYRSIGDIVETLRKNIIDTELTTFVVRRSHFLKDVLRKCPKPSFKPNTRLLVRLHVSCYICFCDLL